MFDSSPGWPKGASQLLWNYHTRPHEEPNARSSTPPSRLTGYSRSVILPLN